MKSKKSTKVLSFDNKTTSSLPKTATLLNRRSFFNRGYNFDKVVIGCSKSKSPRKNGILPKIIYLSIGKEIAQDPRLNWEVGTRLAIYHDEPTNNLYLLPQTDEPNGAKLTKSTNSQSYYLSVTVGDDFRTFPKSENQHKIHKGMLEILDIGYLKVAKG